MRQPRPPLFAPLRRLGDSRACCLSRPVLGTTPVQGSPWLPRSVSELAEFPCDAHHSCSSSEARAGEKYRAPKLPLVAASCRRGCIGMLASTTKGEFKCATEP